MSELAPRWAKESGTEQWAVETSSRQLRACAALIAANCSSCSASVKRAGASLASSAATPQESPFADMLLARRHRLWCGVFYNA